MKKAMYLVVLMAVIVPSLAFGEDDVDVRVINDPAMTARLDRAGAIVNLGTQKQQAQNPKLWQGRLRFRVYDDEDLNAFALADGRIFVSSGMMTMTKDDNSLLIAILNHEATHVVQKHHRGQTKKAAIWRIGTLLAARAIGAAKDTADTASQIATGIAVGGYSRKDERRADEGSVDLCIVEGVDPYAPARVMKKLQDKYGNGSAKAPVIGWFASHPDTGGRAKALTERAKSYTINSTSEVGLVGRSSVRNEPFGGVAVIVRDNSSGGWSGFWGNQSVEEAAKTTMENALEQTGRFTIVDRSGRNEAWEEQDLGDTGRMDPATMPKKGKTVGAKYFLYVTINYYQVTEEGTARVGNWQNRADVKRVKAEIRGKVKLEPVEKSVLDYTTDFKGSEVGYDTEASVSRRDNDANATWSSRPAGQAVEKACQKVAGALVGYLDSKMPVLSSPRSSVSAVGTIIQPRPNPDRTTAFILFVKPHPHENKMEPLKMNFSAPWSAVQAADYLLFVRDKKVVAKINIEKTTEDEVWGTIEYPYLHLLDPTNIQKVQLMKSD